VYVERLRLRGHLPGLSPLARPSDAAEVADGTDAVDDASDVGEGGSG
jgi:hypothetical protein